MARTELERRLATSATAVSRAEVKLAGVKADRATVIREASAAGMSLSAIANLVGLSKGGVDKIVNDRYAESS